MRILKSAVAALALTVSMAAHAGDGALIEAVSGTWRTPENVERDKFRKPIEVLTFWGLKPGMTVLELSPGGGWWTEILAPYARATKGNFYATAADLTDPALSENGRKGRSDFAAKYADAVRFALRHRWLSP